MQLINAAAKRLDKRINMIEIVSEHEDAKIGEKFENLTEMKNDKSRYS